MAFQQVDSQLARRSLPAGLSLGWLVALVVFLVAIRSNGYGSDLGYWSSWMSQLHTGGYRVVNANYPPLLLHWLWVGAQFLDGVALGLVSTELVKWWTVFPVWLSWIFLIYQVACALERSGITPRSSWVFWLTVCNPAIIADGPQWGQVDLLPWIPISLGLIAHQRGRHLLGPIFFVLGVAAKFQAIVYAPIFAGLYLRAVVSQRRLLWAIPVGACVFFICFLPFFVVERGWEQVAQAYWNNIGGQPAASNNAGNLWKLLGVGEVLGSQPLFQGQEFAWATPKVIGLFLFGMSACLIFVRSLRKDADIWGLAVAANFCFFAFCPEMHERYLFGAVPAAAMWAANDRSKGGWYALATAITFLNISFVHFPRDNHEWQVISALAVGVAVLLFLKHAGLRVPSRIPSNLDMYPRATMVCVSLAPLVMFAEQVSSVKDINVAAAKVGESILLADLTPASFKQEWGSPRFQRRLNRGEVEFSDAVISSGIMVHASSEVRFQLPQGRFELSGRCGPQKIANSTSTMRFTVMLGAELLWESADTKGASPAVPFTVVLQGPGEFALVVDPLGSNFGDHGLWGDVALRRLE
jgi:Gpi18-like mannosyltransferase